MIYLVAGKLQTPACRASAVLIFSFQR
jgi:hypothetical protein